MPDQRVTFPLAVCLLFACGATRAVVRACPPEPVRMVDGLPICGAEISDRLVVGLCVAQGHDRAEPSRVRRALGRSLCWHTADADLLATISGVGPVLAERLAVQRDRGMPAAPADLMAIAGVGAVLARRVGDAVTEDCPRVATPHRTVAPLYGSHPDARYGPPMFDSQR